MTTSGDPLKLKGGTGLEVLRAVRRVEPGIPFVVFSNNSHEFDQLVPALVDPSQAN